MKKTTYENMRTWLEERQNRVRAVCFVYRVFPWMVVVGYFVCLAIGFASDKRQLVWNIAVPAAVFVLVTVFRALVDAPRPYQVFDIPPLVPKEKQGQSFPSRHAACAGVIAMAWWRIDAAAGLVFLAIAVVIAASRVLAGVHFVRDVVAGLLFGVGVGAGALALFGR